MRTRLALQKIKQLIRMATVLGFTMVTLVFATANVYAEVIDRIDINQVGDQAEIQLHFITPIQYKRQATLKNGDLRIYLTLLDIKPDDPRLVWAKKDSPPSDIVPPFTVTYPELDSSLTLSFGKVLKCRVRMGSDGQSLSIFTKAIKLKKKDHVIAPIAAIPLPIAAAAVASATAAMSSDATAVAKATPTLPEPAPKVEGAGFPTDLPAEVQHSPEQIQQEAQRLFVAASDALQAMQVETSIESLNKVLNLPPNVLTQPAQELMGEAREKNGEFAKARVEYELYLKLYPNAADSKQVQARIANLPTADAKPAQAPLSEAAQKSKDEKFRVTGGISQNYYKGMSHTDTFDTSSGSTSIPSTGGVDQSQLVTSLDLMGQKRTEFADTRIVVREFNRINFLPNQPKDLRWNAVYVEQSARDRKYMYRLGRQSGSSGGTPGRFDGVSGGYSINPTWRVNASAGKPVEFVSGGNPADPKTFYSGSIDLTRLPDQWSGSAYGVMQYVGGNSSKSGGIKERSAFGAEAHYFQQQHSYLSQIEYDTLYHKLNLATFQGNWSHESGTNYYMSIDHRRSPPLAINLTGQISQSLKTVLDSGLISLQTLRDNAIALSSMSNMLSIGVSRPYSSSLRFATDFRVSNTSGTGDYVSTNPTTGVTVQPGSLSTGNQYVWSTQAIGNNLFFDNDLGIANYSYSTSSSSKSNILTFNQVETFSQKWRADASLQLSNSRSLLGANVTTQVRPSMTLNYTKSNTLSFSAEGGVERNHSTSGSQDSVTLRKYFFVGYRWDFR